LTAGTNAYLNAERNVTIEAKERITFKVGQTTLEMSEKGVEIAAPFIVQRALVKAQTIASIVDVAATMQVNVYASVMTSITSNGMVNVAGGGVLIN
jgi:hypothetical protein